MPNPAITLSPEEFAAFCRVLALPKLILLKRAALLGITKSQYYTRLNYIRSMGSVPAPHAVAPSPYQPPAPPEPPPRLVERDDIINEANGTWEISAKTTERIHTLERFKEFFQIDEEVWEILIWKPNIWEGQTKNRATNEVTVTPLYQIKATLKKKFHVIDARAELEALRKKYESYCPVYAPIVRQAPMTGTMIEFALSDHHFMKLAWGKETRHGDYDLKIAEELFDKAIETLLQRTYNYGAERILFVIGNDALNSDNRQGTTTAGTPQSNDTRYHKGFAVLRDCHIRAIERMRLVAPVDVVVVPGNHDELSAWHLGDTLQSWFRQCGDVKIDNAPTLVKYYRWGQSLLGLTHGDKGKKKDYPLLMAQEAKQDWADTKFREWHVGHLHKEQEMEKRSDERMGVKVRVLPSLCAADSWHSDNLYVGNIPASQAFAWHRVEGPIGMAQYSPLGQAE